VLEKTKRAIKKGQSRQHWTKKTQGENKRNIKT